MTSEELISRLEAEGGWTILNGNYPNSKDQERLSRAGPVEAYVYWDHQIRRVSARRQWDGQWPISRDYDARPHEPVSSTDIKISPPPPTDRNVIAFRTAYDPDSEWVPIESGQLPEVGKHICLQDIDGYMYEAWLLPSKQWDIIKADVDSEVIIGMLYSVAWRNLFPPFEKSK